MNDVDTSIGYLVHHISSVLARQSDQVLQEQLGIGYSQFKIMLILERSAGKNQKQVATLLGQTEASISRQVKLLERENLLRSQINPQNRKEHILNLTPRGIKFYLHASSVLHDHYKLQFAALGDKEKSQLENMLLDVSHSLTDK